MTPVERVRTTKRMLERLVAYTGQRKEIGADGWVVQRIQAEEQAQAPDRHVARRGFRQRSGVRLGGRPGARRAHRARNAGLRQRAARAGGIKPPRTGVLPCMKRFAPVVTTACAAPRRLPGSRAGAQARAARAARHARRRRNASSASARRKGQVLRVDRRCVIRRRRRCRRDVYLFSGGSDEADQRSRPGGGDAGTPEAFGGSSTDGTVVAFTTAESLVAADGDSVADIYVRSGTTTTLVSDRVNAGERHQRHPELHRHVRRRIAGHVPDERTAGRGDGDACQDAYLFESGTLNLLSGPRQAGADSRSANGSRAIDDVRGGVITTAEPIVVQDGDTSVDVYLAKSRCERDDVPALEPGAGRCGRGGRRPVRRRDGGRGRRRVLDDGAAGHARRRRRRSRRVRHTWERS